MQKIEKQLNEMSEAMQSALKLTIVATASVGAILTFIGAVLYLIDIIIH